MTNDQTRIALLINEYGGAPNLFENLDEDSMCWMFLLLFFYIGMNRNDDEAEFQGDEECSINPTGT